MRQAGKSPGKIGVKTAWIFQTPVFYAQKCTPAENNSNLSGFRKVNVRAWITH
jgi:hypothetical protein